MKHASTLVLKAIITLIGLGVAVISFLTLLLLLRGQVGGGYGPILVGMYVSFIPFFFALYQALRLLGYIDKNKAFSTASVQALKNIKYSAVAMGAMYTLGMPYIYIVADRDDAPGVIVIGMVIIFCTFIVAAFGGVAQKLFQNGVDIKSENDLTV